MTPLDRHRPVHFVGIGGAGMSALAELLVTRGWRVSGCDVRRGDTTARLEELGIDVREGHDPGHLVDDPTVVVTAAVPPSSAEIAAARERGLEVVSRKSLLGKIMSAHRGVAVAGTHGKSTTTAMTGSILETAGWDPTVLVGGRIRGRGGNVRIGEGEWLVAEADEYDRAFHALEPARAIVTNVEADHLDVYGTEAGVVESFERFLDRVDPGGTIVLGVDSPLAAGLSVPSGRTVVTFSLREEADATARDIRLEGFGASFTLLLGGEEAGEVRLALPGRHNVANALAAAAMAAALGIDGGAIRGGLAAVRGVARRFERVHEDGETVIVDDYAHHPTEIAATLGSLRDGWPGRRIVAVFQPHLYSRTRDFAREFGAALTEADVVFVTGVYAAREDPIEGVDGEMVAAAAREAGADRVVVVPALSEPGAVEDAVAAIEACRRPGDLVVTLGAGDVDRIARALASAGTPSGEEVRWP